jgi:curved DNA-binding protein CbpA
VPHGSAGGAYYRRLDLGPGASHDEIVRAYRRLAFGVHPDAHPDDPAASMRFREITEAYEVLGDPVRRQAYDGSRPSRHIPVLPRHATGAAPEPFGEMATAGPQVSGPPTVLGASKPRLIGDALLCAGPVHIGPSPGAEDGTASFASPLFAILDSWWKR